MPPSAPSSVVGPDKKIKLMLSYPMSTGRNFDEVLRVVDSMQLTGQAQSGYAGELEAGRRCHHPRVGLRRRGQKEISRRLESPAASLYTNRPASRRHKFLPDEERCALILKQFYLPCLAHASYIIGDEQSGAARSR